MARRQLIPTTEGSLLSTTTGGRSIVAIYFSCQWQLEVAIRHEQDKSDTKHDKHEQYFSQIVEIDLMASRLRLLRARALKAVFQAHAKLYEVSDGRVGKWIGPPILGQRALLLSVTGRKSGLPRTTPLVYFKDGGNFVVVGSDGAARRDPQWWKNLKENPHASVRVGRDRFPVRASLASGTERERLWQIATGINPMWAKYQSRTRRSLPVVVLTPE
jgi:deazaflavin-dependent oxidoreductase (nitroreductase family)